jgi:hypothetical protein
MDYLTVKEAGQKWGITSRMVALYCVAGRIEGATKKAIYGSYRKTLLNPLMEDAKNRNSSMQCIGI